MMWHSEALCVSSCALGLASRGTWSKIVSHSADIHMCKQGMEHSSDDFCVVSCAHTYSLHVMHQNFGFFTFCPQNSGKMPFFCGEIHAHYGCKDQKHVFLRQNVENHSYSAFWSVWAGWPIQKGKKGESLVLRVPINFPIKKGPF